MRNWIVLSTLHRQRNAHVWAWIRTRDREAALVGEKTTSHVGYPAFSLLHTPVGSSLQFICPPCMCWTGETGRAHGQGGYSLCAPRHAFKSSPLLAGVPAGNQVGCERCCATPCRCWAGDQDHSRKRLWNLSQIHRKYHPQEKTASPLPIPSLSESAKVLHISQNSNLKSKATANHFPSSYSEDLAGSLWGCFT